MSEEEIQDGNEVPESDDIISEFENTPEGDLKQSVQEENLGDEDFDYQQGFNSPQEHQKDSITKFYRWVVGLMKPYQVVRVANFTHAEAVNTKMYLNLAKYNEVEGCKTIRDYLANKAVIEAAVSMGKKGFIVTNIMTQRRVVTRQQEKSAKVSDWSKGKQQQGSVIK